ncbi:hypothetical protein [Fusobacterium sp. MFO224]|uniref:hypothetical protein n=1 Tax=Fusobacterium sp. MFO224 TaxID=3378070 RepID=UPI003854E6F5
MKNTKLIKIALIVSIVTNVAYADMKEDLTSLNNLYSRGEYNRAVIKSKDFIKEYPDSKYNKDLALRICKVEYLNKNYSRASNYFEDFLRTYKLGRNERMEVYSYLYRINKLYGNIQKTAYYEELLKKRKKSYEEALFKTGILLVDNENNISAIKEFEKAISLNGQNYEDCFLYVSLAYVNIKEYREALTYIDQYYKFKNKKKTENLVLAKYIQGTISYKENDIENATKHFKYLIEAAPGYIYTEKSKVSLIEIYLNSGEIIEALKLYPTIDNTYLKNQGSKVFGNYFVLREQFQKGIEYYEKIEGKKDDESAYNYAYALYKIGNYSEAIAEFSKIEGRAYDLNKRYYIILSLDKNKDYETVINYEKYLEDYVSDSKKYNDLRFVLSNAFYELKDYEKAFYYIKEIYRDYPTPKNLSKFILITCELDDKELVEKLFDDYKTLFKDDEEYAKEIYLAVSDFEIQKKDLIAAEKIYVTYLKTHDDSEIRGKLIDLLINQKKYAVTIKYLNSQEPTDDNVYLKGIAYIGIGNYENADKLLKSLLDKTTDNFLLEKTKFNIIKNYFLWEKYEDTIKEGKLYLDENNHYLTSEVLNRISISYYRLGDYNNARKYYEILGRDSKFYSYSKYQIADSYYTEKNYKKALELFGEIISSPKIKGYKELSEYWSINCYLNLDQVDEYLNKSTKFIKDYPDSIYLKAVLLERGKYLSKTKNYDGAIKEYTALFEKESDSLERDKTVEKILDIYILKGTIDSEKKWIDKINDKFKKSYYLSHYYRKKEMINEALKEEKILLESQFYKDYALKNLGEYNYEIKANKEARKYFEETLKLNASLYKDLATFRIAYLDKNDKKYEEALKGFTKVIVMYPKSNYVTLSKINICEIYETQENIDKAIKAYEEVYKDPKADSYLEYLVEKLLILYLRKDDKVNSDKYYNELMGLNKETAKKYEQFLIKAKEEITDEKNVSNNDVKL